MKNNSLHLGPALFFYVNGTFLFHGCSLEEGEAYGNFINYPYSHFEIWEKNYRSEYDVDFDYFPRGRIIYRKTDDTYLVYYDKCLDEVIGSVAERYSGINIQLNYDEHYQCYLCNDGYVV